MMKRIMACLLMLAMMLLGGAALADEAQFYLVNYDANGHGYAPTMQTKNPGEGLELSTDRLSEDSYIFAGWSRDPKATQAEYMPGDLYTEDADVTLYAVWLEPRHLGEIKDGDEFEIAYPILRADGYVSFTVSEAGWYRLCSTGEYFKSGNLGAWLGVKKTGSKYMETLATAVLDPEWKDFSVAAELEPGVTYYLQYKGSDNPLSLEVDNEFYTVKYDVNGHGTAPQMQTKNPGEGMELSTDRLSEDFYIFAGWSRDPKATQAEYMPGDLYTEDADVTLYAVWLEPRHLGEIKDGDEFEIAYPILRADGYVSFTVSEAGWYRLRSTGEYFKSGNLGAWLGVKKTGSKYMETLATAVLDPEWKDFSVAAELEPGVTYYLRYKGSDNPLSLEVDNEFYTVKYDVNGHGTAPQMQTKNPGEGMELSTDRLSEDFYIFAGWSRDPKATQAEYMPGDLYTEDADVMLYAVWLEPRHLGEIKDGDEFEIAYPILRADGYVSFTVGEAGWYRLRSTGEYFKSGNLGAWLGVKKTGSKYMETLATAVLDPEWKDFSVAAELEPGVTYYLRYKGSDNPLNLVVESRYRVNKAEIDLVLPSMLEGIESEAFAGGAFGSVYCPETVKAIGARAFADCAALREVAIAAADVQIDAAAFDGCGEIVIIAPRGSTAHEFATENGLEFREIEEE